MRGGLRSPIDLSTDADGLDVVVGGGAADDGGFARGQHQSQFGWRRHIRTDVIDHKTGVIVEIPIDPDNQGVLFAQIDPVIIEIKGIIAQCQLPRAHAAVIDRALDLNAIKRPFVRLISAALTGQEDRTANIPAGKVGISPVKVLSRQEGPEPPPPCCARNPH